LEAGHRITTTVAKTATTATMPTATNLRLIGARLISLFRRPDRTLYQVLLRSRRPARGTRVLPLV
jgi:hypothetical protein